MYRLYRHEIRHTAGGSEYVATLIGRHASKSSWYAAVAGLEFVPCRGRIGDGYYRDSEGRTYGQVPEPCADRIEG